RRRAPGISPGRRWCRWCCPARTLRRGQGRPPERRTTSSFELLPASPDPVPAAHGAARGVGTGGRPERPPSEPVTQCALHIRRPGGTGNRFFPARSSLVVDRRGVQRIVAGVSGLTPGPVRGATRLLARKAAAIMPRFRGGFVIQQRHRSFLVRALSVTAGALLVHAAALAAPGLPEMRRLDNGLRVVLLEDHAVPLTAVSLWVGSGSKYEVEGSSGYAHFLEHLIQRGTATTGPFEYTRRANRWGGGLSVRSNYDRTSITAR